MLSQKKGDVKNLLSFFCPFDTLLFSLLIYSGDASGKASCAALSVPTWSNGRGTVLEGKADL